MRKNNKIKYLLVLSTVFMLAGCNKGGSNENYSNTIDGVISFIKKAAETKNYTTSYTYEDNEYKNYYNENYLYYGSQKAGYVVIDNFFSDTNEGAVLSFTVDEDNKSIFLGTAYGISQKGETEITYPDSLIYLNALDYYMNEGYESGVLSADMFEQNSSFIYSTDVTFNYYVAALGGFGDYISDGSAAGLSYTLKDNTLAVSLIIYDLDGETLVEADGTTFYISDVGTTTFEYCENYLKSAKEDFSEQPLLDSSALDALLVEEKWSLDIERDSCDKNGTITSKNYKVLYDYDNVTTGKKGITWKQYLSSNDSLNYSLIYEADENGTVISKELDHNNEIKQTIATDSSGNYGKITAFNTFKNYYGDRMSKRVGKNKYQYFGQSRASILNALTMYDYTNININYLYIYTKTVDGNEVVDYIEALLYTPGFSISGVTMTETYELVKITVNYGDDIRDIDTTMSEPLPSNVEGVTDRIQTAIDRINDNTQSFKRTIEQYDTLKKAMYATYEETFTPSLYLKKETKNSNVDYRGIKTLDDGSNMYFVIQNGKVLATSSSNDFENIVDKYPTWECSPAIYQKVSGEENTFEINGRVKDAYFYMPIKASDTPTNLKITLDATTDFISTISYTINTYGGYIVDDYDISFEWGSEENVIEASDDEIENLQGLIDNLAPLSEDELPTSWTEDLSDVDEYLLKNGFTQTQIDAIPYLYHPALSGNWINYERASGIYDIYSTGEKDIESDTKRKAFYTDYQEIFKSEKAINDGWEYSTKDNEEDIITYINSSKNMTIQLYDEADYGITVFNYVI